jgi:predicted nucleotidyltransferase
VLQPDWTRFLGSSYTVSVSELHEKIRRALEAGPSIRLAILFGSRARGTARPDSDIDLAIVPADSALSLAEEDLLAASIEAASGLAVDLVRLDRADGALRWRVARDAVVLISNPANEAARFLARAGIEHDELRELEMDAMRRYRAHLARAAVEPAR